MSIAQELPRLTMELEKLNKVLSAPAEAKNNFVEALRGFRKELLNTVAEASDAVSKAKSVTKKSVQE